MVSDYLAEDDRVRGHIERFMVIDEESENV